MHYLKKPVLFALGGGAYVGLELLWRGRSHITMFLAGGACFLLIGKLEKTEPRLPIWLRVPVGALIITMVELGTGLLWNRDYQVWDYRSVPGNFLGQICPVYMVLWLPVALLAELLYRRLDRTLSRG